ncbi:MAG: hypothetical protein K2X81_26265, partial [Candidatus Obscuribacterales bacterium]|nr:hypothetical protein [Candidatus Obscuribacterales bacterium]
MNHWTNDGNNTERSERPESKAERLEKKAENKEHGEACTDLAKGALNKEWPFYGKDFDPEARQVAEKLS